MYDVYKGHELGICHRKFITRHKKKQEFKNRFYK